MAVQPTLDPEPSGVLVSGMCAAVFASMLRVPLRRRVSLASGIDPANRDELLSNFEELARVGRGWMASRPRVSVAAGSVTEMVSASSVDMEINTEKAAELLNLTTSRVRQLLRSGELPGRLVGRRWVVKRSAVMAYRAPGKAAA
jgi:excisionase family DNA binding protein